MLRNLLIAITKAFKWFVGWPRPVLVPKFKTGCEVWYSTSRYDEEAEGGAAIGTVEIVKVDRAAEEINYLIKTKPHGAVWRKESQLQPYASASEE